MMIEDDGTCIFLSEPVETIEEVKAENLHLRQASALVGASLSTTTAAVKCLIKEAGYPLAGFDIIANLEQLERELYAPFNNRRNK